MGKRTGMEEGDNCLNCEFSKGTLYDKSLCQECCENDYKDYLREKKEVILSDKDTEDTKQIGQRDLRGFL